MPERGGDMHADQGIDEDLHRLSMEDVHQVIEPRRLPDRRGNLEQTEEVRSPVLGGQAQEAGDRDQQGGEVEQDLDPTDRKSKPP